MTGEPRWERLSDHVIVVHDTTNVYLVHDGEEAVAIDFGDGAALDLLTELGLSRITDVFMTHHHRDGAQGLPKAVEAGARIWVPPVEEQLFADVESHWQSRELLLSYNNREDRFSLLWSVPVAGTLPEYRQITAAGVRFEVVPTPGHTVGSISLLATIDGQRLAFSGDLIAAPGQVWSLSATQWSYNGGEGIGATILSAHDLARRAPDRLLPAHGAPIEAPRDALLLLAERLGALKVFRDGVRSPFFAQIDRPYRRISEHLLANLSSNANSYVLLSRSGKALIIDYGYDASTGLAAGSDRAARRPWLYTLPQLKEQFGVSSIDVAIPTHYHDDHLAGFNLLREVEGTRIWAGEQMVEVLEHPLDRELPCLWFDPIPVDRSIELERPVQWEEYELTLHPLPGHTIYAVAIEFVVDGKRVLAVGDQLHDEGWLYHLFRHQLPLAGGVPTTLPPARMLNYVYNNGFRISDYRTTAELYRRLKPDLMLYGHWAPGVVTDDYLTELIERGTELERLHLELLADERHELADDGPLAVLVPYQPHGRPGQPIEVTVELRNPLSEPASAQVAIVVPAGWQVEPRVADVELNGTGPTPLRFTVCPPAGLSVRRERIAADVTVDGTPFGQVATALVTLE